MRVWDMYTLRVCVKPLSPPSAGNHCVVFQQGGDRCVFERFLVTNSIPTTTDKLPRDDVYVVLDLVSRIKEDLDLHSSI